MDKVVYESLWDLSFKPKIDRMLTSDDGIFFVEGQIKEKIWLTYEECKTTIHTYMHNPDGRIDRHKVASVMLYSILKNKPFELILSPSKHEVKSSSFLANEILGFHAALAIVWSFIITDANEKSDKIRIEIFKDKFILPKCQYDDYQTHVYKMLYYAKYNNHYDIFAFSHILFFIEAYTELKRRTELAEKAL